MAVFYLGCSSRTIRDSVVDGEIVNPEALIEDEEEEEPSAFRDVYDSIDPDDDVPVALVSSLSLGRRAQSCVEYSSYRSNLTMRLQRIKGNVNVTDETRCGVSWNGNFKGFGGSTLFERRTGLKHNFSLQSDGPAPLDPPSPLCLDAKNSRKPHAADEPHEAESGEESVDPVSLIDSCSSLSTSTAATSPLSLTDDTPFSWPKEPISGLVSDKYIHDKFHQRPLLADTEKPFVPCEPVFESVDEMLKKCYPGLAPEEHAYHRQRLISNRHKLLELRQHVESQYAQRRRNSATSIATSQYEKALAASVTEKRRMRVKLH